MDGKPKKKVYDGSLEQTGPNTYFQKVITKNHINTHKNEAETQKFNCAKDSIRELKRRWKQRIIRRRAPKRIWDFGIVWEAQILSRMARHNNDFTGMERITGNTVDINGLVYHTT